VSKAYLSYVLSGQRKLTLKKGEVISQKLGHNHLEKRFFKFLISLNNAEDDDEKEKYIAQIESLKKAYDINYVDIDSYLIISNWKFSLFLEAINLSNKKKDIHSLKSLLAFEEDEFQHIFDKLLEHGLIELDSEKKVHRTNGGNLKTANDVLNKALQKLHESNLRNGIRAIAGQSVKERNFNGITMAIDSSKLPAAKQKVRQFVKEMSEFLESGEKDKVYHLEIGLFDLMKLG
jgi:uncharacterized protein (TIGR02147 family)